MRFPHYPTIMKKQLIGQSTEHLIPFGKHFIHKEVVKDLEKLIEVSKQNNFTITLASSFRSFDRQLSIWNEKALGQRVLLDSNSHPLDPKKLSHKERLFAILRWSAVPGFSRHHWGTDFDIYDAQAVDSNYQLQLIPQEYNNDGPFTPLTHWLSENMGSFFHPYRTERGGVSPEPWHISHKVISQRYFEQLSLSFFISTIEQMDIELKEVLLENAHEVYHKYITNID